MDGEAASHRKGRRLASGGERAQPAPGCWFGIDLHYLPAEGPTGKGGLGLGNVG